MIVSGDQYPQKIGSAVAQYLHTPKLNAYTLKSSLQSAAGRRVETHLSSLAMVRSHI